MLESFFCFRAIFITMTLFPKKNFFENIFLKKTKVGAILKLVGSFVLFCRNRNQLSQRNYFLRWFWSKRKDLEKVADWKSGLPEIKQKNVELKNISVILLWSSSQRYLVRLLPLKEVSQGWKPVSYSNSALLEGCQVFRVNKVSETSPKILLSTPALKLKAWL